MKINFDFYITDLKGDAIIEFNVAEVVANTIAGSNIGSPIKMMDIAMTIFKTKEVELNEADANSIKSIIESAPNLSNLSKAQILERFTPKDNVQ
jgi:hypothetical protein